MPPEVQLSLLDLPESQAAQGSIFLALTPDDAACTQIVSLSQYQCDWHGFHGTATQREHLHVTLHDFGDYIPGALIERKIAHISAAAEVVAAARTPFEVHFNRVATFAGRSRWYPIVLTSDRGNADLRSFIQLLGRELTWRGVRFKPQSTPHVTFFYGDQIIAEENVDTIKWVVRDFTLILSSRAPFQYTQLGRWSLQG